MAGSPFTVGIDPGASVGRLKDAIKNANSATITCDPKDLQIFPAKIDGEWLKERDVVGGLDASVTNGMAQLMYPSASLLAVGFKAGELGEVSDKAKAEGLGCVHVLVRVAKEEEFVTKIWSNWKKAGTGCPALEMGASSFVRIPAAYADDSGVAAREGDLLLYRRRQLVSEWQTLKALVCDTYAELWIVGPPGVGKSCAAFAFACSLDRTDWDVVWVHFPKNGYADLLYILFRGASEKWTCSIDSADMQVLLNSLNEKTIVFLDGFTAEKDNGARKVCSKWRLKDKLCRRLVWVSSMVTRGKDFYSVESGIVPVIATVTLTSKAVVGAPTPKFDVRDQELYELVSWTMEDYEAALENSDLFNVVKFKLTSDPDPARWEDRNELLQIKFFVAGGNARYMFDYTTEQAEAQLRRAINCTPNMEAVIKRKVDIASPNTVNRLFSWYHVEGSVETKACLLSKFVAGKIAQQLGPEFVQDISSLFQINPAMDGYLLNLWFFAKLVHGGVDCYTVQNESTLSTTQNHGRWYAHEVPYFDPLGIIPLTTAPSQWMAPRLWNQGGYDAVCLEIRERNPTTDIAVPANCTGVIRVRFVQVTRAKTHSFKELYFKTFLTRLTTGLSKYNYWFEEVEVYFVTPIGKLVQEGFKISVTELTLRKDVLRPASIPDTTKISVLVVGVDYAEYKENPAKRLKSG